MNKNVKKATKKASGFVKSAGAEVDGVVSNVAARAAGVIDVAVDALKEIKKKIR